MLRRKIYESEKAVGMYERQKVKRYRSAFTTSQINYLEKQFEKCPYIGSATRKEVANLLNIPERAIKIWFQNRRMKEKKEVNSKECIIDRHNNLTNNVEFGKDSLINAHSSQSLNDRQYSLQSTIAKHVDAPNCSNYYDTAFSDRSKIDNLKREAIDNHKPYKFRSNEMLNYTKQEGKRTSFSEPTNLTKCNLNKNYNNKNFVNYLEINKKSVTKNKILPITTLKAENLRDSMLNISSPLPRYQELPEDLSARNMSHALLPQNHQGNIHLSSAYIPFCNTQDVCLSGGNVIWKQFNVMPAVSSNTIPVTTLERQSTVNQNNEPECKCSCNCHSRNRLSYDQKNIESQPQYVIAIPYNNNINILR